MHGDKNDGFIIPMDESTLIIKNWVADKYPRSAD